MAKATLYFFTPDLPHVLGGVRQIYRQVDVLNANGFNAWVVHRKKGFRIKWFEHETRVMLAELRKVGNQAGTAGIKWTNNPLTPNGRVTEPPFIRFLP